MKNKFKINDKVKREVDIYDKSKGFKIGKIIRKYSRAKKQTRSGVLGPYPEIYEVLWNDGTRERGFLPHGLDRV